MESKAAIIRRIKHEPADGRPKICYRIQLVDSSLIEEAVALMVEHFLPRENTCSSIELLADKDGVEEIRGNWKELLAEGVSLAALLEDEQNNPGPIVSVNVLSVKKKDDINKKETPAKSKKLRHLFKTLEDTEAGTDIFGKFNCASYITALGLVVHPQYTRRGIAFEMLKARGDVCRMKDADTPVSSTVFTSDASQALARKVGYETISELDLSEYRIDGELVFRNPKTRIIKYMVKKY